MKTINNRSTLVNKFQGFSSASDDDDRVDRIASCTTSDNRWYRRTSGCGPKEVSACSSNLRARFPKRALLLLLLFLFLQRIVCGSYYMMCLFWM